MKHQFKNKTIGGTVTVLAMAAILSNPVSADTYKHSQIERYTADGEVSASEAKRIVRGFLTERGYSSQMRPGGARIGKVTLEGGIWAVKITLYGASLASHETSTVFVGNQSGLLAESRFEAVTFLAESAEQDQE